MNKSKTKLAFLLCFLGLELLFHQNPTFAGRKDLPLENLSRIDNLSIKVDKEDCQLGLDENEISSSVYSYLADNNIPIDTGRTSSHILDLSVGCESNELMSIFVIDVQVNQFINIDGVNTKVITYDNGRYGATDSIPFDEIEKGYIPELVKQFVTDWYSVR
ncbi:hypothetical protein C7B62_18155 [Pleurocapsa sp. CCALA 161]|uniref:hypothetical protein n=1 Tax=Pleurocapsa sp. CCALA 161 TaxID=2107688 RepID=UPI000D06B209|nr:hypothetical protein [Pleurocapsa sp. CCALA 161]PSB07991.1 hypothetical protein C7B62_18155 [Pleurocapsa sp. CCALA 161]